MGHRASADRALRLSDYRFVELHITSSCFLKSHLSPTHLNVKVALASVVGIRFAADGIHGLTECADHLKLWVMNRLCSSVFAGHCVRTLSGFASASDLRESCPAQIGRLVHCEHDCILGLLKCFLGSSQSETPRFATPELLPRELI